MTFKMCKLTKHLYCMYSFLFQKFFILHLLSNTVNLSLKFILWYNLEKACCFKWIVQMALRSYEKFFTPLEYFCNNVHTVWASLVALLVKSLPEMQGLWVWFPSWEDPLEEGMAIHSSILAWRNPMEREAWRATVYGVTKSCVRQLE